jgi:hypothetical protein
MLLAVMDGQAFDTANRCRHTLSLPNLKENKPVAIAHRLHQAWPDAVTDTIRDDFPPAKADNRQKLVACDLVIDCTAADCLLHDLVPFPLREFRAVNWLSQ